MVMDDLRAAKADFLTLGQYLQPTKKHAPVAKYITPDEFNSYKIIAESRDSNGFIKPLNAFLSSCRRRF